MAFVECPASGNVTLSPRPDDEKKRDSAEVAPQLTHGEAALHKSEGRRQRGRAAPSGVPASTRRSWLTRRGALDADPEVMAVCASPGGLACGHRWVIAAHGVMTLRGPCGLRLVWCVRARTGLEACLAAA